MRVTIKRKKRVDYMGLWDARLCCGAARGGRVLPGFSCTTRGEGEGHRLGVWGMVAAKEWKEATLG